MRKLFNQISIRTQVRTILFALLFVFIGFGILNNMVVQNILLKSSRDYTHTVSQQFNQQMDNLYQRVNGIYQLQLFDSNIEDILLSPLAENSFSLYNYFSPIIASTPGVTDIALSNSTFHWSVLYDNFTLNEMSLQITTKKVTSLGFYWPSYGDSHITQTPNLVFGKQFYPVGNDIQSQQPIGNIILSIDPSKSSITVPVAEEMPITFLLADKNKNFYSFDEHSEKAGLILEACSSYINAENIEDNYTEFETPEYHMTITYSPDMQYYLISAVDKNALYHNMQQAKNLNIAIWITLSIFILLLIWLIHQNVVRPLNQLYEFIHSIRNGDRKKLKSSIELSGSSEIHSLSLEFSDMLGEINSLNRQLFKTTTELYEMELQKQEAEIAHLRSQINPHFLYNTLEMIKGISLENKVPKIAVICNAMGKMFRYSIKGASIVSFESELEMAKAYLQIQSIRFENKFQVFYSIDEGTKNLAIIKMLLQPIIENAIIHGLEGKAAPGILYIGTKVLDSSLIITIQDDGVGMDDTSLLQLQKQLQMPLMSPDMNEHIGVVNVHKRIQIYYGTEYGVFIESIKEKGTIVTLTIPAVEL